MKNYSLYQIPMILASFGLFAGIHAENKKMMNNRLPQDCSSLCADRPGFDCDKEFDIEAAAIYEQFNVQSGDVAFITQSTTQALYPVNGVGVDQPESFNWGFKVGAGYSGWNDNWRTSVKYTYFRAVTNTANQPDYGAAYIPSVYTDSYTNDQIPTTMTSFQSLQMGNNTNFNRLVFALGRPSMITERVSIDTYYAIEASFFNRRQLQVYTNDIVTGGTVLGPTAQRYVATAGGFFQNYQKYSWWGVGPAFGVKGDYYLGKGVSIFGDALGILEYGSSGSRTSTLSNPKTGTPGQESIVMNNLFQFSPAMNIELGANWRYIFDEDQVRLSFQIAYESSYYFMVIRTVVPYSQSSSATGSGLGMQGLVLQGMLEF